MNIEIKTNNHWRELISWFDLSEKEKSDFDWIDDPEESGYEFFRYKKQVYSLSEFMRVDNNSPLKTLGYDGYYGNGFFSGVLIKLSDCCEAVKIATYYS